MSKYADKVREMIALVGKQELDKVADMYAEDGVMEHPSYSDPGLNEARAIQGRENIRQAVMTWDKDADVEETEIYDIMEKDNKVFALWCCTRHNHKTGEKGKLEVMSYFTFEGELIKNYKVYFDRIE